MRLARAFAPIHSIPALALLGALAISGCAPVAIPLLIPVPGTIADAPRGAAMGNRQTLPLSGIRPTVFAPGRPATAEATGTGAERAFVTDILRDLQVVSFRENREYCGYIGRDAAGRFMATPYSRGIEAGCALPPIPSGMTVLASFHTHSTYSPVYASEFPTTQDMRSDATLGVDGYISTPGGRLWYVDSDTLTVRELCGRGCLPQDPNYRAGDDGPLRPVMTFEQLRRFERGGPI